MRIYIAGPMRGIPFFNFPAFDEAKAFLESKGHTVISPADLDRQHGFDAMKLPPDSSWEGTDGFDMKAAMLRDIHAIAECDAIALMSGWEKSTGATAEHHVAKWLGKVILDARTGVPFPADTTKPSNPKDMIGSNKLPLHLWPETATILGCLGLLDGMLKYGRSNYRVIGVRYSIYIDALKRHVNALFEGEDIDPDSGLPHEAHALACLAILIDAKAAGKLLDDRMVLGGYRNLVNEMTPHVLRLKDLYATRNPHHYTIADNALVDVK